MDAMTKALTKSEPVVIVGDGKQCLCGTGCALAYGAKNGFREVKITGPCLKQFTDLPPLNDGHKMPRLPSDAQARKNAPMARGLLDYFPKALAAVAEASRIATEQHHPGEHMHWDRAKSADEADCIVRHLVDRGTVDADGVRHSAKVAWRALAMLERELDGEKV